MDLAFDEGIARLPGTPGVERARSRDSGCIRVSAERLHEPIPVILRLVVGREAAVVRVDVRVTSSPVDLIVNGFTWATQSTASSNMLSRHPHIRMTK